jgi:hypothetical protein
MEPVTDPEHRDAELEDHGIDLQRALFEYARRPTREDDRDRRRASNVFSGRRRAMSWVYCDP